MIYILCSFAFIKYIFMARLISTDFILSTNWSSALATGGDFIWWILKNRADVVQKQRAQIMFDVKQGRNNAASGWKLHHIKEPANK